MKSSQKLLPSLALICGLVANIGSYRATRQTHENEPVNLIKIPISSDSPNIFNSATVNDSQCRASEYSTRLNEINGVNYRIISERPSYTKTNIGWYLGMTMPCSLIGLSLIAAYGLTRNRQDKIMPV